MKYQSLQEGGMDSRIFASVLGLVVVLMVSVGRAQEAPRKVIGIAPVISNVADISGEKATEIFVNAIMETDRFAIKPPEANGSFVGVDYVLEPAISEGKAKTNVLGFIKDIATSKTPINFSVKVFDPQTNTLVNSVTVKSTDNKNQAVSTRDVQSVMALFGAGGSPEQTKKSGQEENMAELEEQLGELMKESATRLAGRLAGGGTVGQRVGASRTPLSR